MPLIDPPHPQLLPHLRLNTKSCSLRPPCTYVWSERLHSHRENEREGKDFELMRKTRTRSPRVFKLSHPSAGVVVAHHDLQWMCARNRGCVGVVRGRLWYAMVAQIIKGKWKSHNVAIVIEFYSSIFCLPPSLSPSSPCLFLAFSYSSATLGRSVDVLLPRMKAFDSSDVGCAERLFLALGIGKRPDWRMRIHSFPSLSSSWPLSSPKFQWEA